MPSVLTVLVEELALVLHHKLPDAVVDKVEVPLQLFTTVTTGVVSPTLGAAVPLPAALVQPFSVVVTV